MAKKKLNDIIIHCHLDGEPSQELIEALNRMADLAAKNLGTEINNGDTEKRGSKSVCRNCQELTESIPMGSMCSECYCEK